MRPKSISRIGQCGAHFRPEAPLRQGALPPLERSVARAIFIVLKTRIARYRTMTIGLISSGTRPLPRWSAVLVLMFAFALMTPAAALADQKDPRLPELFDLLKKAPDPGAAQQVEGMIWALWYHSDNPEVLKLMNTGVTAMSDSDFQMAIDSFKHVTEIAPDFAEGWNKLATAHYLTGDYKD